jgi:glutamine amidotransferase
VSAICVRSTSQPLPLTENDRLLPGLTPVVETNCHPFPFGRSVFCHNGVLGSFHLFKARLLALLPNRYQVAILGTTDSEHIAALYFYHLYGEDGVWDEVMDTPSMALAMRKTLSVLERLKAEAEGDGPVEHNALNLLVNSGSSAVAIRYASPAGHEAPSLYYSTSAGADLNRKFKGHPDEGKPGAPTSEGEREKEDHGKHVIIASEPTTFKSEDWELIPAGKMVVVDGDLGLKIESL